METYLSILEYKQAALKGAPASFTFELQGANKNRTHIFTT